MSYAYSALPAEFVVAEPPLPSVGDFWDVQHPDAVMQPMAPVRTMRPAVPPRPTYLSRRTAPAVSWAFTCALTSVPLLLLFGAGAILGILAIVLGVVGISQANSSPRYRGTGRAALSIAIGASTTIVGAPIMLLTLALFNAL